MREVLLQEVQSGNYMCYVLRWWVGAKRMSKTIGWVKIEGQKCVGRNYISATKARRKCEKKRNALAVEAAKAKLAAEEAQTQRFSRSPSPTV